jgi:hypothetical protein
MSSDKESKKILFFTYYYIPYNVTGGNRVTKFIKYFSQCGYEPYGVTAFDDTLKSNEHSMIDVPENAKITRINRVFSANTIANKNELYVTQVSLLKRAKNMLQRIVKDIFLSPDIQVVWMFKALPKLMKLVKEKKVNYVFITGSPFSLMIAGYILKKLFKIKLVLDFRDPWSTGPNAKKQTFIKQAFIRFWERKLCSGMEKGNNSVYSNKLADKFWNEVRAYFPNIDQVGLKIRKVEI